MSCQFGNTKFKLEWSQDQEEPSFVLYYDGHPIIDASLLNHPMLDEDWDGVSIDMDYFDEIKYDVDFPTKKGFRLKPQYVPK